MTYFEDENEGKIDMAEIWRQNYMDALDEVRNLNDRIRELEYERDVLIHDLKLAEDYIMHVGE